MIPVNSFQIPAQSERFLSKSGYAMRQWKWAAIDLFAPPTCVGCGRVGSAWCSACSAQTDLIDGLLCDKCGARIYDGGCSHCEVYPSAFDQALSYANYSDPFRRILLHLKYREDHSLGDRVAQLVVNTIRGLSANADLIVPVPLGHNRFVSRGFNQVDVFARPLAQILGISYEKKAIKRIRNTLSQVGLTGEQRRQNLTQAFSAAADKVSGKRVLLIDDVFTTGATGNACARSLRDAGAFSVRVFTLARATGHSHDEVNMANT